MITRHAVNKGWIGMMVALAVSGMVTSAHGGSLDSPAAPTESASAMYTLQDVYNRLDSGTAGTPQVFTEPGQGPTIGTMRTLNEVMAKAPAANANASTDADVLSGKAYWGLKAGAWGPRNGTMASAGVPKTGQTTSYQAGDDGDLKKGVAWPNPRFTVGTGASSNCVTDNLTGLMWLKNPDFTARNWATAITYCGGLNGNYGRGGYQDWRLPNGNELRSLIDASKVNPALPSGHPFIGVQSRYYWSSTTYAVITGSAWIVYLVDGYVYYDNKTTTYYVWPVRGGQ